MTTSPNTSPKKQIPSNSNEKRSEELLWGGSGNETALTDLRLTALRNILTLKSSESTIGQLTTILTEIVEVKLFSSLVGEAFAGRSKQDRIDVLDILKTCFTAASIDFDTSNLSKELTKLGYAPIRKRKGGGNRKSKLTDKVKRERKITKLIAGMSKAEINEMLLQLGVEGYSM